MEPCYEYKKSYTKADIKEFGRNTLIAAARIKNHLSTNHLAATNFFECLDELGLVREEIVGIEHLISANSPKDIVKARKMHVTAVFLEQEKQRIVGCMNERRIAAISALVSEKASTSARVRAGVTP